MALPPGITPKTVTVGIASFFDGSLAEGTATITAPVNVVHTPSNRPIFSSQMSHRFVDGETSFNLAPTDAPGLNRVDWTYKLNVIISGALVQPEPVYFILPAAGPDTIDLDALVTVPSSAGIPISATVVTSVNGQTGDVTVSGGGGGGSTSASDLTSGTLAPARIADASLPIAKLAVDIATQAELDALSSATTTALGTKVNSSTYTAGLALKANTADLAAVAQSGSYNDLANKPTIPTSGASSYANTFGLLGSSITLANEPWNQGGGVMADTGAGYFHWANTLLRQSMKLVYLGGVSGDTTGQMLARIPAVIASGARMCVWETGPNDVQGDSTFSIITAALAEGYAQLRAAGVLVFATTIYPTTPIVGTPSRIALMHRVNRWITDYAKTYPGVIVANVAARLTDPATGGPLAGVLHDGIHLSTLGGALFGWSLADAVEPYIVEATDLVTSNGDPSQLVANGMMLGGTTTATGWTINGTATAAKVPRADGDPGEWQQIAVTSGNVELWSPIGTTGWTAGDVIAADFEIDGDLTNATRAEVQVWAVDGSGLPVTGGAALTLADYYGSTKRIPVSRGFARSRPLTIPVGAVGVRAVFIVAGPVTVRVSRASVRKVAI